MNIIVGQNASIGKTPSPNYLEKRGTLLEKISSKNGDLLVLQDAIIMAGVAECSVPKQNKGRL